MGLKIETGVGLKLVGEWEENGSKSNANIAFEEVSGPTGVEYSAATLLLDLEGKDLYDQLKAVEGQQFRMTLELMD